MQPKLAVLVLVLCTTGASAMGVSLVPLQSNYVVPGQTVSFNVVFDWSSDLDLMGLGGAFDMVYAADAPAIAGLTTDFVGDPVFFSEPDVGASARTEWLVGTLDEWPVTGRFGTVTFTILDSMAAKTTLSMQDTAIDGPSWLCRNEPSCVFFPGYDEIELSRVPVPAALWLFLGALAGLGSLHRVRIAPR